jgi:hypothetical protein
MKRRFYLLIFLFTVSFVHAQKKESKVWVMPETGLVAGALNPAADFRLTAGIQWKQWNLGMGIAFDEYKHPSYPLFIQARRKMQWRKWHPFVFGSLGYNYKSGSDSVFTWFGNKVIQYRGGMFAEAGIGLALKVSKKERLFISLYQSYKRSSSTSQEFRWAGPGSIITVPSTEIFRMNRVGLRVGWRLGK